VKPSRPEQREYVAFWQKTGRGFPSLKGAASTAYYFECERLLLERFFPSLPGRTLFKTDLWDEAKNTEILRWAAQQGARPFGIDLSGQILQDARGVLASHRPGLAMADVRAIPFASESFDLVYSMGTIEHFPEYGAAVREIFRVLRPGGTAIIGVPNKADPFLRPLMVDLLNRAGLYAYGMEKSFTRGELRRLLESAGFVVQAESGILFIPGWIRMADLFFHSRRSPFAGLTGALVRPFRWIYRNAPAIRRHGYLIAAIATRPRGSSSQRR
jgi:SAM-dependent methyltransferase